MPIIALCVSALGVSALAAPLQAVAAKQFSLPLKKDSIAPWQNIQDARPPGFDLFGGNRPPRHLSEPGDKLDRGRDGKAEGKAGKTSRDAAKDAERRRKALRALLRRRPGLKVPEDAAGRGELLRLLYGHLAKVTSKVAGARIKTAIEHVWSVTGSDTVSLLMRRALIASKKKDYDKALEYLGYVVKLAPDYTEGWNQRAYVHFKKKDLPRSLGDLRRVLALDPHHYKALEGLARILSEIDEKRAALAVYQRLLKVYPLSDEAKQAVRQLSTEVGGQGI